MTPDRRLIEEYLPVESLSVHASAEPRTRGHISTLHLWRARRPLVACRAAVYASLVDAPATEEERAGRETFLNTLARWEPPPSAIDAARREILAGFDGEPPRVLDLFAGGGSIPLEALRLGCETYAVELNPVAFLILKGTCDYPQRFGAELADDVRRWATTVAERVERNVSDLYPSIPVPDAARKLRGNQGTFDGRPALPESVPPYVFYWTRTVVCPNRQCQAAVPLYRQTWLRRKSSGYVALRPVLETGTNRVSFEKVEADSEDGFDFDPSDGLRGTATACMRCRAPVPAQYVRDYGKAPGYGQQLMCVVCINPAGPGKLYLIDDSWIDDEEHRQAEAERSGRVLEQELGIPTLDAVIPPTGNAGLATGRSYLYGIERFRDAYTPRQRRVLLEFVAQVRRAHEEMISSGMPVERAEAVTVYLALWVSRLTDRFTSLSRWDNTGEKVQSWTSMKRFAMTWDFPEVNLFGGGSGDWTTALDFVTGVIEREGGAGKPATVVRGSATRLARQDFADASFDAVITDPPYYDNESYSELSDAFYVWLQPMVRYLFPEHFAGQHTPKKHECVAAAYRQGGTASAAKAFFESCLADSLAQARRVLKPSGILTLVYAHKTTAGWATLVNALREGGFEVREAWPVETETRSRAAHQGDAALRSSIFFAARPRATDRTGSYETEVRPDLDRIAAERVATLWAGGRGLSGADLLMASVGACLQPYTRFPSVEYENGEHVAPETYLRDVEEVVLGSILDQIFDLPTSGVARIDRITRFYVLWRFTFGAAPVDAGEAVVFCYPQGIELDGPSSIVGPLPALVEQAGTELQVRTFQERGADERLGVTRDGLEPPLIDVLHRVLWLLGHRPGDVRSYLARIRPNTEKLRLVAQALAGPVLTARPSANAGLGQELGTLGRLTANWRSLVETAGEDRMQETAGQTTLPFDERVS